MLAIKYGQAYFGMITKQEVGVRDDRFVRWHWEAVPNLGDAQPGRYNWADSSDESFELIQ
jgi:hypothetical protein